MKLAFVFVCVLITYGSLYPFDFAVDQAHHWLELFRSSWRETSSRGDIFGNVALFAPYGLVGVLAFSRPGRRLRACLFLALAGIALSVACQAAQVYLPSRVPAVLDVVLNAAGMMLGISVGLALRLRPTPAVPRPTAGDHVLILLLSAWLVSRLAPFVPAIDLQSFKDSVRPLFLDGGMEWSEVLLQTAVWLVVAHFAASLMRSGWRVIYLPIGIVVVLCLEVLVVFNDVALTDVVSAVAAAALWASVGERLRMPLRSEVLAILLLIGFVVSGILPVRPNWQSSQLLWIPFAGFLHGPMLGNAIAFGTKLFVFGSLFRLFGEAGHRPIATTVLLLAAVLTIELFQVWLSEGTPDVTEPILVLLVALTLRSHRRVLDRRRTARSVPADEKGDPPGYRLARFDAAGPRKVVLMALAAAAVLAAVLFTLVRLTAVPYNVRELFVFGGTGIDLLCFALALLWIGCGTAWAGHVTARSRAPALSAPAAAVGVSIALYLLFRLSVTEESIRDIAGSSVFVHRVGVWGVLGRPGIEFVEMIGAERLRLVTDLGEPAVRFGALWGPLLISLQIVFAALFAVEGERPGSRLRSVATFARSASILLVYMLPWLFICKVIAFDWSSTDNLNELIARDGAYGLGGGGYLYALTALIAACAAFLAWTGTYRTGRAFHAGLALAVVSVPVGWLLLNAGLEEHVRKYGRVYSGVDFLLGPDRATLLSGAELFVRWAAAQLGLVGVVAFGASLCLRWIASRPTVPDPDPLAGGSASRPGGVPVRLPVDQLQPAEEVSRR